MDFAEYEFHPLANEYEMMTDEELSFIVNRMKAKGFNKKKPITLFEGKILDGRNRYKAAKLAGVEPVFEELPSDGDPQDFVFEENDDRRHREEFTRRRRKLRIARVVEARNAGSTLAEIAEKEGVSETQVRLDLDKAQSVSQGGCETDADKADSTSQGGCEVESETPKIVGKDGKARPATYKNKGTKRQKKAESQAILENVKAQHKAMVGDKPKTEPKATDHFGIPIQPHAVNVFAATVLFDEILAKLKECRKLYATLAEHPGGVRLLQASTSINAKDKWENRGIENAILSIEDARPYMTVCPYEYNAEHPHEEDCTLCKGLRWTVPFSKGRVPADLIEAAKGAFNV